MTLTWTDIFKSTLREPEVAAGMILSLALDRRTLWTALIAAAALNAVVTGMSLTLIPLPPGFPEVLGAPFVLFVAAVMGLLLFAVALTWAGSAIGGTGQWPEILSLMIWLQMVRIALQVIGIGVFLLLPFVYAIYTIITALLSLWILICFIKVGHGLQSLGTAVLVLFAAFVGVIVALSLLLAVLGIGAGGGI